LSIPEDHHLYNCQTELISAVDFGVMKALSAVEIRNRLCVPAWHINC